MHLPEITSVKQRERSGAIWSDRRTGDKEVKPEYGNHSFEDCSCEGEEIDRMALEREIRNDIVYYYFLR